MTPQGRLVAARYRDGKIIKGYSCDFRPDRPVFHVRIDGQDQPTPIALRELKAVFFIKTIEGDPRYEEEKEFNRNEPIGEKTWLEFFDGEKMAGWAGPLPLEDEGFYVLPTDPQSNLEKAWVVRGSVISVIHGEEAESASRRHAARKGIEKLAAESWTGLPAEL